MSETTVDRPVKAPGYDTYNYPHFLAGPDDATFEWFRHNLRVGEEAPDFEAVTVDGERLRLSDYTADQTVVIEFGNLTCPFCRLAAPGMDQLAREYADKGFAFLFVHTREAHPGENYRQHTSMEQKIEHARAYREMCNVERPILVDDLEGTIHHQYGLLPDMCYMIGRRGRVQNTILFKADWTNADALRVMLDYQMSRKAAHDSHVKVGPNYCEFLGFRPRVFDRFPEFLEVSGPTAIADWDQAMRVWRHDPPTHG